MSDVKRYFPEGMKISLGYFSPTTEFVLASDYDALAAELAACKTARDGWTRASDAAHARIRVLESALTEVKAVLRETHGGRHYEPECPECVWLDGATALETVAELAKGCHRSHPHEDMDAGCQRLTEIARANNKQANMEPEARCWYCGKTTAKDHYDDCDRPTSDRGEKR